MPADPAGETEIDLTWTQAVGGATTTSFALHLSVEYDNRIRTIVSNARQVTDYTEIPSGQVTSP